MQKKAEMSHHVPDEMVPEMMDFPLKSWEKNIYANIFSLLLFPHLAWVTPNFSCRDILVNLMGWRGLKSCLIVSGKRWDKKIIIFTS